MSSYEYSLSSPPVDKWLRELWMQHAAGFVLFQDIREYAIGQIPQDVNDQTKAAVTKGIDDAVYGLMMVLDGVSGTLRNDDLSLGLKTSIELHKRTWEDSEVIESMDVFLGDGMCMGYHWWMRGDFGECEVAKKKKI